MAVPTPLSSAPAFSQKQRRAALRKERRKRKRQALAQVRECGLQNGPSYVPGEIHDEDDEDGDVAEEERLRLHEEWLGKERFAQEEFRRRAEREDAARKRKEDEERMIKEEWEAQQKKEQEEKEQKQQDKRDREVKRAPGGLKQKETQPSTSSAKIHTKRKNPNSNFSPQKDEAVRKMLDEAENQEKGCEHGYRDNRCIGRYWLIADIPSLENGQPWMNPEAPVKNCENFGTERDVANCPFFLKTGACRFGDRCSRKHVYPTASPTLMIRAMFTTFGMEQSRRDDYDVDACLEHSEEELQESFLEFYHDVLPELKSIGKVVQFKVSCNYEPHLRGNVYIQFETEEQCKDAIIKFNGRFYAGRQLQCEMCPVTRWKNAICGLFDRQRCPKGKHCNFLHVFRNPSNEFWEADRDLHMSPDRSVRGSRRDGWHSERYGDRSWRQRQCSRSPPRSERFHGRRDGDRQRSRSRERRASQRSSRHSDRPKDWYLSRSRDRSRSRSRDRSRSRSRDREQDRPRNRSREKDREHKSRNRSEVRDCRDKDADTRDRSRSASRERKKEKRPKKPDKNEKPLNEDTNTRRRHKQSKKSKKKSKKKNKKKSYSPGGTASSGESEKEKESEEETPANLTVTSPGQEMNETEPIQKNNDLDERPCVDSEKFSSEGESEHSEIPGKPLEKVT